jgi:SAM-dependent methyltransferase
MRPTTRTETLSVAYDSWHRQHSADLELDPHAAAFFHWVLDLAEAAPGTRMLDVACGSGAFLGCALDRGVDVVGIDVSPAAIELAARRVPGVELHVGDAENLPFDDSSFGLVTCLGSLEHFPSPERGAAEIARVVRPDGRAIVFVPNLFFLGHIWFGLRHGVQPSEGEQDFSESFRTSQGWRSLLERAGLVVERWEPWNTIHASQKVGPGAMRLWNAVSRFVPRHGAYAFAYVCSKQAVS